MPTAPAPPLRRHAFARGATPLSSGGDRLPPAVQSFYEPRFGQSLTDVRVHTGPAAASYAGALRAQAFTYGDQAAACIHRCSSRTSSPTERASG